MCCTNEGQVVLNKSWLCAWIMRANKPQYAINILPSATTCLESECVNSITVSSCRTEANPPTQISCMPEWHMQACIYMCVHACHAGVGIFCVNPRFHTISVESHSLYMQMHIHVCMGSTCMCRDMCMLVSMHEKWPHMHTRTQIYSSFRKKLHPSIR